MNPHHLADGLAMLFPDEPTAVARLPMRARLVARADRSAVNAYRHERELARMACVRPDPELVAVVADRRARRAVEVARVAPGMAVSPWIHREGPDGEEWVRLRQSPGCVSASWRSAKHRPAARVSRRWGEWRATTHHACGNLWQRVTGADEGQAVADAALVAAGFHLWETL